jgi:hypothetical protein
MYFAFNLFYPCSPVVSRFLTPFDRDPSSDVIISAKWRNKECNANKFSTCETSVYTSFSILSFLNLEFIRLT